MPIRTSLYLMLICMLCLYACRSHRAADDPVIVQTPEDMDEVVSKNITDVLSDALSNNGKINDTTQLFLDSLVDKFYNQENYKGVWSSKEVINPLCDSLLIFIRQSMYYGLFPEEYNLAALNAIQTRLANDSLAQKDATLWTRLDLLSTDAFMKLMKDLRESRMRPDSLSVIHDKNVQDSFFVGGLKRVLASKQLMATLNGAEPASFRYQNLRAALPSFVDSMDTTVYLGIEYPAKDSLALIKKVYQRLLQSGIGDSTKPVPDSSAFVKALKKYQAKKGLEVDGKLGKSTISALNTSDMQKFKRVALTLDKYKELPPLPEAYIWVNIPAFRLEVWMDDTLALQSRVVVGKPATPSPTLVSEINNMVTYPVWNIPTSIIKSEILPQLKKDPGYLARKGYNLFTEKGDEVNPYTVDWSKYKSGIPWRVVQGSGDDNALGVFKFNFNNPFSVYLHDTNQRYLFANANRALSHGCIRVQKWRNLADLITLRDSTLTDPGKIPYNADSINSWISGMKRKTIYLKHKFPLYVEYITCEGNDGKLIFYNDIYNEDERLIQKYYGVRTHSKAS